MKSPKRERLTFCDSPELSVVLNVDSATAGMSRLFINPADERIQCVWRVAPQAFEEGLRSVRLAPGSPVLRLPGVESPLPLHLLHALSQCIQR